MTFIIFRIIDDKTGKEADISRITKEDWAEEPMEWVITDGKTIGLMDDSCNIA